MTDEELIERLRDWPYQGETMANAAADRIEALVKERDKMETEAHAQNELWRVALRQKGQEKATIEARVVQLETALQWQAEQPEAHPFMVARALEALKGGKP